MIGGSRSVLFVKHVERWISKDNRYARKTEHGCKYLYVGDQRTVKSRNQQNGSKSTKHCEERDLLTPLSSIYSFAETFATLIDGSETQDKMAEIASFTEV